MIITGNWISRYEAFYSIYTAKHPKCKFITVQHGAYVGGNITLSSHKYCRSDIFLTWGSNFSEKFKTLNSLKNIEVIDFGNPLYNAKNRDKYKYQKNKVKRVLIANSGVTKVGSENLLKLIRKLSRLNIEVHLKMHPHQEKKFGRIDLSDVKVIRAKQDSRILESNLYDVVISDHSTFLLDAIFYKKKVIYFPQFDRGKDFHKNLYSDFLDPLELDFFHAKNGMNCIYDLVSIEAQEALLAKAITLQKGNIHYPFYN